MIDAILKADRQVPRKQRHTAKPIFERLRDEHGFDGGYTTVKDYVRERRRRTQEMCVPLSHAPGHAFEADNAYKGLTMLGAGKHWYNQLNT